MDLSSVILGSAVVNTLKDRQKSAVLTIGKDTFTRAELAHVDCFNYMAAANLSAILLRELRVKDTAEVFNLVSPHDLALPRLGAISLAVLGAAFEAKGLGGNAPLENWMRRHLHEDAKLTTFGALKHRDEAEHARERKQKRERKAARRNQAHRIRVDRFTERQSEEKV